MSVSVIIPALDEERTVADAVASVRGEADEVLVVDGGSSDGTRDAAARAGARVLSAARGRGLQLDHGARQARGDWLVFLHADTQLETGWAEALAVIDVVWPGRVVGGAFRLAIDSPRRAYRWIEAGVHLRSAWLKLPYGDQALFARREAYARCGGFPPWPLMEDVAFVRRLRRVGTLAFPQRRAFTSPRRWERGGIARTTWSNLRLLSLYVLGRSPERLARDYGHREVS
jgi:rSAM/selenodomain-associated transferase 2